MRFAIVPAVLLLVLFSCKRSVTPEGVLPPEKMELVLWDMIQADEFLRNYRLNIDSSLNDTTESLKLYSKVFQLHKIKKEVFQNSFAYYKTHPALMKRVLDSLNVRSIQAPPEINQPRPLEKVDTAAIRKARKPILQPRKL